MEVSSPDVMLKGKRILVIDDSEAERMLISTYLHQQGCRVYHAHDGIDGIHKARLLVPDLILMDLDMPGCDGYTACQALSRDPHTANVPIIFLSGFSVTEKRIQGLLAGAVDYIGKPYDFDEVRLRLLIHLKNEPGTEAAPETQIAQTDSNSLYEILFHGARIYLLNSLANPLSLEDLAKRVSTNSKRLNEAFRHCSDMTVFEYLREKRMQEAQRLLRSTSLSITEIAERVGFSNSANFSTSFKEHTGVTPSRFRQMGMVLTG